jgi:hypothetical protein
MSLWRIMRDDHRRVEGVPSPRAQEHAMRAQHVPDGTLHGISSLRFSISLLRDSGTLHACYFHRRAPLHESAKYRGEPLSGTMRCVTLGVWRQL